MSRSTPCNIVSAAEAASLGAREIFSFAAPAANDNDIRIAGTARGRAIYWLPATAFASGLGAALLILLAGHLFGTAG